MPSNHWYLFNAIVLVCLGCGSPQPGASPDGDTPLKVVATTGLIGDAAQRIAGDHAQVEALMGPGVDPHLFKASESDVRRLGEADLILYNGLHLEGKMTDILGKMSSGRKVLAVGEAVPDERLRRPAEFEGQPDPHLWFDVDLWSLTLEPIADVLSELDAAHADVFRANAAALKLELADLDSWVQQSVATVPEQQRVLVTAHDAFGYFGGRYGFRVVGIQGFSTATEAGLTDVERVVDVVAEAELKAIFVEASVPQRTVDAVRTGCEARGQAVTIGGELFSDSLGATGTEEGTYMGMVRHNVETIVEALR